MSKKVVIPASPKLIVVPSLSRRKVLEGFGALALPIVGGVACSSDPDDPPGTVGGSGGAPGAGTGPTGGTGTGVAGSLNPSGGTGTSMPTAGSPAGGASNPTGGTGNMAGSPPNGGMAGSGVTGGTSPGGGPSGGAPGGGAGAGPGGRAGAGGMSGGGAGAGGTGGALGGMGGGGNLVVPTWDSVAVCKATGKDPAGQGPFFIHDKEKSDDVSLFRQDMRGRYNMSAEPGIDMQFHLRVLDSKGGCMTPVPDAEVYIWHTDGQGFYSGFGMAGDQKPDEPYRGVPGQNDLDTTDRFCRGAQVTNAQGVVSFLSIFPGWYNGRDVHIHVIVLKKNSASRGRMNYTGGDHIYTSQMYFETEFTKTVHEAFEPYKRRTTLSAYRDSIDLTSPANSGIRAKAELKGEVVTAQVQLLLDPNASVL